MMDDSSLMKTIDESYFADFESFNLKHLTSQLPDDLTSDYLLAYKSRLNKLLLIVSSQVSSLILSHQPAYVDELKRIADLQLLITESIRVCTQGRSCLGLIKDGTAKNGANIVKLYTKRKYLNNLLNILKAIKLLRNSVIEIRYIIDQQQDLTKAIDICKMRKSLLSSHLEYNCVEQMANNLNNDVNERMKLLINNHDLTTYKFDEFMKVLKIVDAMARLCDELSDHSSSKYILDCINSQTINFFDAYHKSSMDEQRMFMENELWDVVPVKIDFKLADLKEFHFLKTLNSSSNKLACAQTESPKKSSYFSRPTTDVLSLSTDSDEDEEDDADVCEDDESLSSMEEIDEQALKSRIKSLPVGPILTNSSLNILRLVGRYMQIMRILEPISYEILMKIYNLLDYYTMKVYSNFGPNEAKIEYKNAPPRLSHLIRSIRQAIMSNESSQICLSKPLGPNVASLIKEEFGASQRVDARKAVAIESLIYLVNQIWNLHEYLESLIPANMRAELRREFEQSSSIVPDFLRAKAELERSN